MKSSIKITNGGNTIHATGDAANELQSQVDEGGEDVFTPMPDRCRKFGCNESELKNNGMGFMVCQKCGGSYGRIS